MWTLVHLYWRAQLWTQPSRCASAELSREKCPRPQSCWQCSLPKAPQDAASHLCKDTVTSHMELLAHQDPTPLPAMLLPASQCPTTRVTSGKLQDSFHINSPHPSPYLHSHSQKIHTQTADSPSPWQTPTSAQSLTHCMELSQNATSVTPEKSFPRGETSKKVRPDTDQKKSA